MPDQDADTEMRAASIPADQKLESDSSPPEADSEVSTSSREGSSTDVPAPGAESDSAEAPDPLPEASANLASVEASQETPPRSTPAEEGSINAEREIASTQAQPSDEASMPSDGTRPEPERTAKQLPTEDGAFQETSASYAHAENDRSAVESQSASAKARSSNEAPQPERPGAQLPLVENATEEASAPDIPIEAKPVGTVERETLPVETSTPPDFQGGPSREGPSLISETVDETSSMPSEGETAMPPVPPMPSEDAVNRVERIEEQTGEPSPIKPKRGRRPKSTGQSSHAANEELPPSGVAGDQAALPQPEPTAAMSTLPPQRIIGDAQAAQGTLDGQSRTTGQQDTKSSGDNQARLSSDVPSGHGGGNGDAPGGAVNNPNGGIPWVPIVVVVVIALLFLLILVWLLPRDGTAPWAFGQRGVVKPVASTVTPDFYTDDLYGFTIRRPKPDGLTLAAYDIDPECKGVVFASEMDFPQPASSIYPRLRVCFVAFDAAGTKGDIAGLLEARCDQIERNALSLPVRGLMRSTKVGQKQLSAREAYIRAKDRETQKAVKLYEAVVEFEQRIYTIEAAAEANNWDSTWPIFRDAIASLQFSDGIVTPPEAPITIP